MVNRWVRHLDLLQVIDMEPNFKRHPYEHNATAMKDRPMHKDEIQRVCEILGLSTSGTVSDLRDRLRDEYFGDWTYGSYPNPKGSKAGTSQFSTKELLELQRIVKNELRLDANEVDIWNDVPKWGGEIVIDGDEYEVVDKSRGSWKDSWKVPANYEEYECYKIGAHHFEDNRRRRLMVLRGLNYDECSYLGSVVLEKKRNYGPYERWKKVDYVNSVEVK